ncbi:MAG: 4a-hydroxytetrahydrobiopterin dehydratase [Caldilineaceae bacterium]|nr:4a-hydroxytetrahydrobiopterin dehydratase [Caldilineaceae bacterium]
METHSVGGITAKDFELARKTEDILLWMPGTGDALAGPVGKWVE